jgi:hypothetical protein
MSDISVLEPVTREVAYRGGALTVSPLTVGQIPAFSRTIAPMFAALADIFTHPPSGAGAGGGGELLVDVQDLLELAGEHGDRMIDAVAIATGQKREDIAAGNPAEFIDLLVAVIEVNADFFARAMAKAQKAAGRRPSST